MSNLEFSNNGLIDSLTHAPAPDVFLANLSREYAGASREKRVLSILSIRPSSPQELTETQLISMARVIVRHLRLGEYFSRISEDGFWVAVKGDQCATSKLAKRILEDSQENRWRTSIIECAPSQSFEKWLSLSDQAHFSIS
jgi:GGDEF domain-containing protein